MKFEDSRRGFILGGAAAMISLPAIFGCRADTFAQTDNPALKQLKKYALPSGSEWGGAIDVPANVGSRIDLSNGAPPNEQIRISGKVFRKDGKTPAAGTLIYFYHTDKNGIYGRGAEHRHGKYRGWLLTDKNGEYRFKSIKPASYPDSTISSHIHMTVTAVGLREDWIDSILFEGDRFLTARERRNAGRRGGFNNILDLRELKDGSRIGSRNIRLNI